MTINDTDISETDFSASDFQVSTDGSEILFIDDDLKQLESLSSILKSFGYRVYCLSDGTQVSNMIQKQEFDLVITDLKLRGTDGLEVLRAVKAHQPETPVIIITGYASMISAIEAMHEGAYDYLVKPCNIKEMKLTIERGIQQRRVKKERDTYFIELQEKNKELHTAVQRLQVMHEQLKDNQYFRETMVSMFTHDIFNPLTSIDGFINVLINDPLMRENESQLQYLSIIQRNIKKIEFLANTFQTFYKIDTKNYEINIRSVNLCNLVRDTVRNVEIFGIDRNIGLKTAIPDENIFILGDPFELERAITNILYNAIKFSPTNSIVECSLRSESALNNNINIDISEKGPFAILQVKDYGIGISDTDINNIFKKFYRASNARKYKGSGVGLFITKFIIDLHNGSITAESALEKGSLFSIYLPITDIIDDHEGLMT